ncbi:helix-turn-helix transcriptional regulator [Porphyromonas gingivalis]|uniref:helix-turn-helix transcriptional regulator n=1 Tax=Porphyromonas gingivalis TaxID=837 RepID=UPI000C190B14|nr:helix-turn-helix transcriptional regulator [Porphyromonas gingivalis]ATR98647.1 transcriptional regulator [Porphyromonas gingivalis]
MDKPMNRIKEVLEEKGIKQTWLAEKLGKSFSIVNAYVCNRRQPSLEWSLNRELCGKLRIC